MGSKKAFLGELEQMVLLAVLQLGSRAYGPEILRELADAGRKVSRGALYTTFDRLEKKALLAWQVTGTTPERGGLPMRRFTVTPKGVDALRTVRAAHRRLARGLEGILGETP